jgi:hypothetical protein
VAWFNTFNNSLIGITFLSKQNTITGHNHISSIARHGFENTANGAGVFLLVGVVSHHNMQTDEAGDSSSPKPDLINDSQELISFG